MRILFFYSILFNSLTGYAQSESNEILIFKNFDVNIINFVSETHPYSESDSSKIDTLCISENPCDQNGWYIGGATLKIVPKNANDSFALSFAYNVYIFEVNSIPLKTYTYFTEYKTISSLAKNKFKIPVLSDASYIKSIKKKYNFQDTLIIGASEGGPFEYRFTRNGKVFGDNWNSIYLRIKRFNNGKLIENKYIVVGLTDGCD